MIIAVNTRGPLDELQEDVREFIVDCFSRLAKKHPQHQFIFVSPAAKTPLLLQYWYNYKLPAILRKHKADVFFSADGICSLRTKVPQCLLVSSTAFLQVPQSVSKKHLRFFKKFMPKFLEKSTSVVTLSVSSKDLLLEKYKIGSEKVAVIPIAAGKIFQPISHEQKEIVKEKYSDGKEYFLFTGSLTANFTLINILKAFSFFKKRQKSNMQLLISAPVVEKDNAFTKALATFKFRDEVKLLSGLEPAEQANLTAAAYAFVYPVSYDELAIRPLEAMQCEVPVIAGNTAVITERCGDAMLLVNLADHNEIAENMTLLFKNEGRRHELIEAGRARMKGFDIDQAAEELWQILSAAIK